MGSNPTPKRLRGPDQRNHISFTRSEPRGSVPSSSAETLQCGGPGSREESGELGVCLKVEVSGVERGMGTYCLHPMGDSGARGPPREALDTLINDHSPA